MPRRQDALSLSVAMCTYNGAPFVSDQLESIARQRRPPDELVVCDDNSRDQTMDILSDFARAAPFTVRIIRNPQNLGSTKNFEKTIETCTGDLIALADQDDVWHENKLAYIVEAFAEDSTIDMVFSDAEVVNDALEPLGYSLWESIGFTDSERAMVSSGSGHLVLLKHNVVTGATMAFRAEARGRFLPIPGDWVHDGWIAIITAATAPIGALAEPLIRYRQHPGSQIGAMKPTVLDKARFHVSSEATGLRATASDRAEYLSQLAHAFGLVAERLEGLPGVVPGATAAIEGKVNHIRARTRIVMMTRRERIRPIFHELRRGNYARYSYGVWSVGKDMLVG